MTYTRRDLFLFLTPLLAIVALIYGMMAWTVYVSMNDWVGMAPHWNFSGLKNYVTLFHKVDGATTGQIFRFVIVPNVGHATMIVIGMLTLFSLKVFDLVWVMTMGGPGTSTEVLPYFMFVATFRQQLVGLGAAISVVILLLAIVVVVPYAWWSMRRLQK